MSSVPEKLRGGQWRLMRSRKILSSLHWRCHLDFWKLVTLLQVGWRILEPLRTVAIVWGQICSMRDIVEFGKANDAIGYMSKTRHFIFKLNILIEYSSHELIYTDFGSLSSLIYKKQNVVSLKWPCRQLQKGLAVRDKAAENIFLCGNSFKAWRWRETFWRNILQRRWRKRDTG